MGTSPTTQSALQSGAAKDDVVGLTGDYNFSISDLLANDPGGAQAGQALLLGEPDTEPVAQQEAHLSPNITHNACHVHVDKARPTPVLRADWQQGHLVQAMLT